MRRWTYGTWPGRATWVGANPRVRFVTAEPGRSPDLEVLMAGMEADCFALGAPPPAAVQQRVS